MAKNRARDIVRDLAALPAPCFANDSKRRIECALCGYWLGDGLGHKLSCPWRRAREWAGLRDQLCPECRGFLVEGNCFECRNECGADMGTANGRIFFCVREPGHTGRHVGQALVSER